MIMSRLKKEMLDRGISKLVSRKLLVWIVATIGVPLHLIDGEQWLQVSIVYIGTQAAKDFIIDYVKAKATTQNNPPV